MLEGLDKTELLRNLKQVVPAFLEFQDGPASVASFTESALMSLIGHLSKREDDPSLASLLSESTTQEHPVEFVLSWVNRLDFKEEPIETLPHTAIDCAAEMPAMLRSAHALKDGDVVPAPVPVVTDAREVASDGPVDRWVLQCGVADVELLGRTIQQIHNRLSAFDNGRVAAASARQIAELARSLRRLNGELNEWLKQLPDPDDLDRDYEEALRVYLYAKETLGFEVDAILSSRKLAPQDLREAIEVAKLPEHLAALPKWAWSVQDDGWPSYGGSHSQLRVWVDRLILPQVRERVKSMLEAFRELTQEDFALVSLVPPPLIDLAEMRPIDARDHITAWLRDFKDLILPLPHEVRERFGGSLVGSDSQRLIYCGSIFRDVKNLVARASAVEIVQDLAAISSLEECQHRGDSYLVALQKAEEFFGPAACAEITFKQLKAIVEQDATKRSQEKPSETYAPAFWVDHNWVDKGSRVPLFYFPHDGEPYGSVTMPLLLRTKRPAALSLTVKVHVQSKHREGWPAAWPQPEPNLLEVKENSWRTDSEQREISNFSFALMVPIKRKVHGDRFKFELKLTDKQGHTCSKTFEWDLINDKPAQLSKPAWQDSIDPRNVERSPIGPQRSIDQILLRFERFGSCAVMAPRRFGKSTLVEFLKERCRRLNLVVPDAIVCTHYFDGRRRDYERLWGHLSNELQRRTGAALSTPFEELPHETAFDDIRRAAKNKGKKGILILLDEAQLFFPTGEGARLGDLLKDRLERFWARQDQEDLAPVMMAFVGLPSIERRAGANLVGFLRPFKQDQMYEDELKHLLKFISNDCLHTTREAREHLAKSAGNLYVLRTILDKLAEDVFKDKRTWANYNDVVAVEEDLKYRLRKGQAEDLGTYVRDILNDAESVNEWEPSPALALAVAVAFVREQGGSSTTVVSQAQRQLRSWCEEVESGFAMLHLTYDDRQFGEHLRMLAERGVFGNGEFSSALLQAWLLGLYQDKQRRPDDWRTMLTKAAIRRIRCPEPLQALPDAEGGQARVWVYFSEGKKLAVRKTALRSEVDRSRFIEEKNLLDSLAKRMQAQERGYEYIFRVVEIGLAMDNEWEAIQIYCWVEGVDLSRVKGKMEAPFVTDIGRKLARALQLLHGASVLHRDLRPQNIILTEETSDPVIIDFGFARRLADIGETRLADEWAAPEVRSDTPVWSPRADIYSVGKTLLSVLSGNSADTGLRKLLGRCIGDPDERPSAKQLESELAEIAIDLRVDAKKEAIWSELAERSRSDRAQFPWFGDIVDRFRPKFEALALGCGRIQFDRSKQIALFLNHVLEGSGRNELSKGRGKAKGRSGDEPIASVDIEFLHFLRTSEAHFLPDRNAKMARFGNPDDATIRQMTLRGAEQIAKAVGIASLREMVERIL
jgi:serine/threonine protein kinase